MLQLEAKMLGVERHGARHILHLIADTVKTFDEGVLACVCELYSVSHVILRSRSLR